MSRRDDLDTLARSEEWLLARHEMKVYAPEDTSTEGPAGGAGLRRIAWVLLALGYVGLAELCEREADREERGHG